MQINAARTAPVIESSLAEPAGDNDAPELAAAEMAPSGQDQVKDPSLRYGGAGEEGQGTGTSESGARGTGERTAGLDAGHGSAGDNPAGGGALLDFGAPGGPEIVRLVRPIYPYEARRLGKEGQVILKLSLEATGEVEAVEILQPAGFGMDEAARKAVQQSRFRPATRGGRSVGCQAILPVRFTLR